MSQFESEICSRCHGTGQYSYCATHGTRCFKCGGKKSVLTKRGRAAFDYFIKLCSKTYAELSIGDKIKSTGLTNGNSVYDFIGTIVEIAPGMEYVSKTDGVEIKSQHLKVTVEHPKYGRTGLHTFPNSTVRVYGQNDADKLKLALEHQETLTKQGLIRKSKNK